MRGPARGRPAAVGATDRPSTDAAPADFLSLERCRIAREIHDSWTQSVYGIFLLAETAERQIARGHLEAATARLLEIRDVTRQMLDEMRTLIFRLRSPEIERLGLAGAIRTRLECVEARAGIETFLSVDGEPGLPPASEEELLGISVELLNNTLKHARAGRVDVRLRRLPGEVILEIADDGRGFDLASCRGNGGRGLAGIEERAQTLGADVDIDTAPGRGTRVRVRVPLDSLVGAAVGEDSLGVPIDPDPGR